jgi:formate dehydrogenase accessory protein FdhD
MERAVSKKSVDSIKEQLGAVERVVSVWPNDVDHQRCDLIAQEVAVALVYNGVSHAVMMASPLDLEAFALGFSLTEGIINQAEDIYAIDILEQEKGIEVALTISSQCFMGLKTRRRNLTGRSGCGLCGAESLNQVRSYLEPITTQFFISHSAINRATSVLAAYQPLQELTGAVHGAAWCDPDGNITRVCEDVGRHNALDKLIGLHWGKGFFHKPGFLLISSRGSYEIVQKAAKAGIAVVVAVSAPTSLAIDIAKETGITLIGFSRQDRHVAYTHDHRLTD